MTDLGAHEMALKGGYPYIYVGGHSNLINDIRFGVYATQDLKLQNKLCEYEDVKG